MMPLASTYRLQLTAQFGFDAAARVIPFLKRLGISHLYASPIFKARPGSTHGYDISDHTAISPELGGEEGFRRLSDALLQAEMGLIVDFVPNHMCVEGVRNEWWWNALEFGPRGRQAAHFDIDWKALPGRARVLLPALGKSYADALRDGEIRLVYSDGAFVIRYFDHRFPVRPSSYGSILRAGGDAANGTSGLQEFSKLAANAEHGDREARAAELKQKLQEISPEIVRAALAMYEPSAGAKAIERMHALLERQHYRLANWRLAGSQINYRRFFDINSLAGLRVERQATFDALHPLIAQLLREGRLQGLRIDHVDGLYDPADYCRRLQELFRAIGKPEIYVIVEKILGEGEELPHWPGVAGTTGYEWMNAISRTLVDKAGLQTLSRTWEEISPDFSNFDSTLRTAKMQVLDRLFAGEFNTLARLLVRIAAGHRATRDLSPDQLRALLREYIVEFPIYRTYAAGNEMPEADRRTVDETLARVREKCPQFDREIVEFMRDTLTLQLIVRRSGHSPARVRRFAMKLQQLTGPAMAKSLEDTALYRDHRLLALNEVGNEPSLPPLDVAEFHARAAGRLRNFPLGLTATATHDTKRGEDARMRILAISELADEWRALVAEWRSLNARHIRRIGGKPAPSPQHEYMLYQAMIGSWPEAGPDEEYVRRLNEYARKAAREGKLETSWLDPNQEYEAAFQEFIKRICDRDTSSKFLALFEPFAERCALIGGLYSLSQTALKITIPGIPDFYQGTELWDLSLVDPDNRRPVDFETRMQLPVGEFAATSNTTAEWAKGQIKFDLARQLLSLRQSHPDLFTSGQYVPISSARDDLLAFARLDKDRGCAVVVGRQFGTSTNGGRSWPRSFFQDKLLDLPRGWRVEAPVIGADIEGGASQIEVSKFDGLPVAVLLLSPATAAGGSA
jgi:(1->4)-alpha-D-glucan 1-alpha-D-glucosylmutase